MAIAAIQMVSASSNPAVCFEAIQLFPDRTLRKSRGMDDFFHRIRLFFRLSLAEHFEKFVTDFWRPVREIRSLPIMNALESGKDAMGGIIVRATSKAGCRAAVCYFQYAVEVENPSFIWIVELKTDRHRDGSCFGRFARSHDLQPCKLIVNGWF